MSDTDHPDGEPTTGEPTATAVESTTPATPGKGKKWQRIVSVVLLVLGFVLMPLSAIAIWTHNQVTNTDRYVDTVSPLASNKDIQQVVATRAVTALFQNVDVAGEIESALPKRAKFLGEPVANAMQGYATDVTERILASDQFQTFWDAANRRAHNQLVALLDDDPGKAPGAVSIKDGQVTLDLTDVIDAVQDHARRSWSDLPPERRRSTRVADDHDHRLGGVG